jgi:nucleotide-binding universal stress UspA family protein
MASEGTEVVVVGVDGSPQSASALAWAVRYARATGASIRAIRAWHYPAAVGPAPIGVAPASVSAEVSEAQQQELDQAVTDALGDKPPVTVQSKIAYGHPAQVLVDESADADLLVVGSRGHGGFTGMLLGSVSMHVVYNAHCPVTVVRRG